MMNYAEELQRIWDKALVSAVNNYNSKIDKSADAGVVPSAVSGGARTEPSNAFVGGIKTQDKDSVKSQQSERDNEGNELSDEQQAFFSAERDSEYMELAKDPEANRDKLQAMVGEAAEQAMKESVIRDEDGKLLTVYHGGTKNYTVFDRTKGRSTADIQGTFFSPWEEDAQGYGLNVRKFYLNLTNPATEAQGYRALNRFKGQNYAGVKAREYLESRGFDGVGKGENTEEYIVFDPENIKSADPVTYDDDGNVIPLSERFNSEKHDIRYAERELSDGTKYVQLDGNIFLREDGTEMTPREAYKSLVGMQITLSDGDVITFVDKLPNGKDMYTELFKRLPKFKKIDDIKGLNDEINRNILDVLVHSESKPTQKDKKDKNDKHKGAGITNFDTRKVNIADESCAYTFRIDVAKLTDGTKIGYAKKEIHRNSVLWEKIKKESSFGASASKRSLRSRFQIPSMDEFISQDEDSVKPQKSERDEELTDREILAQAFADSIPNNMRNGMGYYHKKVDEYYETMRKYNEARDAARELTGAEKNAAVAKANAYLRLAERQDANLQKWEEKTEFGDIIKAEKNITTERLDRKYVAKWNEAQLYLPSAV